MTQITPEMEIALGEDRLMSLTKMIADLRRQVEHLKAQAETGGKIDNAETSRVLTQVNSVVLACTNAENRIDDCRNKQAGIARGGYALDMDKARAEIGCKLDRLRACQHPREVSQ
jgi:hypothetical protein